ncbi:2-oxo acid dehydrogenase subunit E2 [Streptomyces sp. DK15]|uniref:2-oxo acid dehydrogenase subunit E2 n=2 Tax=unclassified Streptomyces TaxID=2593676 RepID=UPI00301927A7
MEHPAVAEAGVIGRPDPVVGAVVKAFVSLRPGLAPDAPLKREILAFARKRLGPAVAPREMTNLGDQGVEAVFGVIYPPQVALVGLGRVTERPVAVDGMLTVHPTVTATLAADHRASDGATGARLLTAIDRLLQRPEEL